MAQPTLMIGRLAASADVNVETVRYYQRRGLLPEPKRPAGGARRYGAGDVSRLQFIRRAQTMGFTLEEIAGLLELNGKHACEQTRQLTEHKLADVRSRLRDLRMLERELLQRLLKCSAVPAGECCPTLDLLEHAGSQPRQRANAERKQPTSIRRSGVRG